MMTKNDGGPAFPVDSELNDVPGMTLRDYFAAAAMQGLLAADSENALTYEKGAEMAYLQADAMLAERAK